MRTMMDENAGMGTGKAGRILFYILVGYSLFFWLIFLMDKIYWYFY